MAKEIEKRIEPKEIEKEKIKKVKIRVIGIGGGGGKIVSEIAKRVEKASFFVADTDLKALKNLRKVEKFQFGQNLTKGFGTGMDPEIGREAAKREREKIKKILENQDLIILISSLGGGTGSGASQIFAKISKNLGNLTYGIFTFPFKFEGKKKIEIAKNSLREMKGNLNAFSIIPNERIFKIIDQKTSLKRALSSINEILAENLQSLIEIIYKPGLINIDFADLKTIFEGKGLLTYLNSVKIEEGIEKIISSPIYPYSFEGAKGVLLNISGPKNLSLERISKISKIVSEKVDKEAKIIFGISKFQSNSGLKITILATGCQSSFTNLEKIKKIKKEKQKKKIQEKKEIEEIKRKNALQLKEEQKKEEIEMLEREKFWETPPFLRKKLIKGQ